MSNPTKDTVPYMIKSLNRACPICNSSEAEVLHHQKFELAQHHLLPSQYDIVCCCNCGFSFADSSANQNTYNQFYAEMSKYEDTSLSSGSGDSPYDKKRLNAAAETISSIVSNKEANILDMGCANGGLLDSLKNLGYKNIVGIDPSVNCVLNMQAKGLEAYQGGLFEPNPSSNKFDLIICSHVFEHIYDLKGAITNISSFLNETGLLYIEVPDASRYNDFYIVPYYYFDTEHINHFDLISLSNLFKVNGFNSIEGNSSVIPVSEKGLYPALWTVFKKEGEKACMPLQKSNTKDKLIQYILTSEKDTKLLNIIESLQKSEEPIYIWGAGNFTARLLAETPLGKCNIKKFIDSDHKKQGQSVNGIEIIGPDMLKKIDKHRILIVSALFREQISQQVKKMGLLNEIIPF